MMHQRPRIKVARKSVQHFKGHLRHVFQRGRGCRIGKTAEKIAPKLKGWVAYFRHAEMKPTFEELDFWIRRRFRCVLWQQWKRPVTREKKLVAFGLCKERAWKSANNGRGHWRNAGAFHMNCAITTFYLSEIELLSLRNEHLRPRGLV